MYATGTMAVLAKAPPSLGELLLFALGHAAAFVVTEVVASKMFRVRPRGEPSDVVLLGSAMNIASITLSLLAVWAIASLLSGAWSWFLAPYAGTVLYVVASGVELALARKAEEGRSAPEED